MNTTERLDNHKVEHGNVLRGLSRARAAGHAFTPDERTDLGGIPLVSSPRVPDGQWLLAQDPARGGSTVVFVGEYLGAAAEVVTAELVACTLGQRRRPELRMDWWASRYLPNRAAV